GMLLMAYGGTTAWMFYFSAGLLVGFGLSGAGFQVVLGAFAKLLPPEWRSLSFGVGTAAGSFGQAVFSPLAVGLLGALGWQRSLVIFALLVALIAVFALP